MTSRAAVLARVLPAAARSPLTSPDGPLSDWPPNLPPWPSTPAALEALQLRLGDGAAAEAGPSVSPALRAGVAACFVCFERGRSGPGEAGDRGWAAAVLTGGATPPPIAVVPGVAAAPYVPGLLALREGALLEAAVLSLPERPALLVVNATGRDHPRRAGLSLQLGARLGIPSIGVTDRPLLAAGELPADERGATAPLRIGNETVACWVRTRRGTRPVVAHAGWRTSVDAAVELALGLTARWRTPVPLRLAREAARLARAVGAGPIAGAGP